MTISPNLKIHQIKCSLIVTYYYQIPSPLHKYLKSRANVLPANEGNIGRRNSKTRQLKVKMHDDWSGGYWQLEFQVQIIIGGGVECWFARIGSFV